MYFTELPVASYTHVALLRTNEIITDSNVFNLCTNIFKGYFIFLLSQWLGNENEQHDLWGWQLSWQLSWSPLATGSPTLEYFYIENKPLLHLSHYICGGYSWVLPHSPTNLWVFLLLYPRSSTSNPHMCSKKYRANLGHRMESVLPTNTPCHCGPCHLNTEKRDTDIMWFYKECNNLQVAEVNRRKGASLYSCSFTLCSSQWKSHSLTYLLTVDLEAGFP